MNESGENFGLEDKRLSLIDVSFDDDFLLYSPSPVLQPPHKPSDILMERKSVQFAGFGEDANTAVRTSIDFFQGGEQEQPPQQPPADSSEPEGARKTGKYNLRKSLAWDSAFFTSAGVLEPEELSSMIGGGGGGGSGKREKKALPGIEEEVHRSTDSISTLASDTLTLETLEADLFGDIRASIQKSNKASSPANSGGKVQSGTAGNKGSAKSLETLGIASGSKLKTKAALKKASVVQQGSGKVMKQVSVRPQIVSRTASSVSKPPKAVGRGSQMLPTTTKRASIGTNRAKVENDNAKDPTGCLDNAKQSAGRGVKVPTLVGTQNTPPRPVLPVKSSLGSSVGTKKEITTSSVDSSGSLSSDNSGKSSLHSVRRKVDSRAGSTLKPTLRTASRNKSQSATSHLSPHLKAVSKLSSSVSPASSVSEWSSGSLSPTSTLNKKSNSSSPSLDDSLCKDAAGNGDAPQIFDSQKQAKQKGAVSTGSNVLHRPDCSRPSGLRMPSPKIGFFDGVRSSVRTPNGSSLLRPVVPSSLPRADVVNVSPTGESNKANVGKLQPHRTITAVQSPKIRGQALPSSTKSNSPSPQMGTLSATPKVSCTSKRGKCSPESVKVHSTMSTEYGGEGRLNGEKASSGKSDMVAMHPNLAVVESNSKDKMTSDGEGNDPLNSEITSTNGGMNTARRSSFNCEVETIAILKEDKDPLCSQKIVNKNLHSLDGTSDELSCSGEQVGGLIKQNKDQVADSLSPSEEPAVGKVM